MQKMRKREKRTTQDPGLISLLNMKNSPKSLRQHPQFHSACEANPSDAMFYMNEHSFCKRNRKNCSQNTPL
jgi:hypothetical protein